MSPRVVPGRPAPCGTYTYLTWPELHPGFVGFASLEWEVTPERDTTQGFFWAHQFAFRNSGSPASGGYAGLQANGAWPGGPAKVAIFSIWNALDARSDGIARRFGNEGEGYQTLIRYPWAAGTRYELRVGSVPERVDESWWVATVRDGDTGREAEIGRIRVPEWWHQIDTWSVVWTEMFAPPITRCDDLEYVAARWGGFTANGGSVRALTLHSRFGEPATCGNSRIEVLDDGSVRHHMGMPSRDSPDR